jgi:hypothetical protein
MSITVGVGSSMQADVSAAGQEAAHEMLSHMSGESPDVLLVFSSIRFADPRMLKAIRAVAGPVPLVGCTDAGSIITAGPKRRSVTVIGIRVKGGTCVTALERNISAHPARAGEHLAETLQRQVPKPSGCLLVFPDGLSASGSEVLKGIEKIKAPGVKLAGASAGDDFFFQKTFQFYNEEILTDSLPGVLLSGSFQVGIGVRHGWSPVGRPREVTKSEGRVIFELDKRPAVTIYEDYLGLKRQELAGDQLANYAMSYPLGFQCPGYNEYLLRDAIRVGKAGSIICTGDVPQGTKVRLMLGGYEPALEAAQQAAYDARDQLNGAALKGGLVFCCVARQKMLGSEFQGEIDVIRDSLGGAGVRMGGFYGYGEFASTPIKNSRSMKTKPLFHNEAVVVVALG